MEMKILHGKSKCVSEVVIGATGCMDDSFKKAIWKICKDKNDISKIIGQCQKAAILGIIIYLSAKINPDIE